MSNIIPFAPRQAIVSKLPEEEEMRLAALRNVEGRTSATRKPVSVEPAEYRLHSLMLAASWAFQTGQHTLGNQIISAVRMGGYGDWILIEDGELQAAIDGADMGIAMWGDDAKGGA